METGLQEILMAREQRWATQKELLQRFQKPLICFTMNIPGPEKNNFLVAHGFALGDRLLRQALPEKNLLHQIRRLTAAGPEGFYVVDIPPRSGRAHV